MRLTNFNVDDTIDISLLEITDSRLGKKKVCQECNQGLTTGINKRIINTYVRDNVVFKDKEKANEFAIIT
jgi:hypothetical protein